MAGRRTGRNGNRSKPKKGINRYDPGNPSYKDAHAITSFRSFFPPMPLFALGGFDFATGGVFANLYRKPSRYA